MSIKLTRCFCTSIAALFLISTGNAAPAQVELKLLKLAEKQFRKDLTAAEKSLFRSTANGSMADCAQRGSIDLEQAETWGKDRTIRASRLVWLCTDKKASALITFTGILIYGAIIDGGIDLNWAELRFPLRFASCYFNDTINLQWASVTALSFQNTKVHDIEADGLTVKQCVFLRNRFIALGEVRFLHSRIGDDLDCAKARFLNRDRDKVTFSIEGSEIGGRVILNEIIASGEVVLSQATIGRDLSCSGAYLDSSGGMALRVESATIGGNVLFNGDFEAHGEVRFMSKIRGDLICTDASVENFGQVALQGYKSEIYGSAYLNRGFVARGAVVLSGASIERGLECTGGRFLNPTGQAIAAAAINVKQSVLLDQNFVAKGQVNFDHAFVGQDLDCRKGQFIAEGSYPAVNLESAHVEGCLWLGDGFEAVGQVLLRNANLGQLNANDGEFINLGGISLSANGADVQRTTLFRHARTYGTVDFIKLNIARGNLECDGATMYSHDSFALIANSASIGGHVFLRAGFIAYGGIDISNASIQGVVDCSNGHFQTNGKEQDVRRGLAIDLSSTKITNDLNLDGNPSSDLPFSAEGTVMLTGVEVGGDIRCDGGMFFPSSQRRDALTADSAEVAGSVLLGEHFAAPGVVSFQYSHIGRDFVLQHNDSIGGMCLHLEFATIKNLLNDRDSWPTKDNVFLFGCTFDMIDRGVGRDSSGNQLDWVQLQSDSVASQPYQQLFSILRAMGREHDAVDVAVAKNRAEGANAFAEDIRSVNADAGFIGRDWRTVDFPHVAQDLGKWFRDLCWYGGLGSFIDYGYRPQHALYLSIVIVVFGAFVFRASYRCGVMLPTSENAYYALGGWAQQIKDTYPKFGPFVYSLETFVPLVKLGIEEKWAPDGTGDVKLRWGFIRMTVPAAAFRIYLRLHILAGWVLTTLWVGGFTGLLKT